METKYKTIFAAQIRAIEPTEENFSEAKASLSELKNLLPPNINPEDEPALLFVAGNLAVAGMVNLNDDGIDIETGLNIYKGFKNQQVNIEHDRKSVVGFIIHSGLTEFGTDRVITEDEARQANKPFNIAIVIALWRVVNKKLCNYIQEASLPGHPDFNSLSLSFEVGFDGYKIIGLKRGDYNIADAVLASNPEDKNFSKLTAMLRAKRGDGMSPDDKNIRLYRILTKEVIPLGGGIVSVPAAAVKGIIAIEPPLKIEVEEEDEEDEIEEIDEAKVFALSKDPFIRNLSIFEDRIEASVIKYKKSQNLSVSQNTTIIQSNTLTNKNMNESDIQSLKEKAAKATKIEELNEVFANALDVTQAILQESERREKARVEAESQASNLEKAKQEAQAASEQLRKDLETMKAELDSIKQAQAAVAAEQAFQSRMVTIEEVFELNDDERSEIVADVRELNDESFAKWMDKSKKLMKEKTREFKKKKADEAKAAQEALASKLQEKGLKVKGLGSEIDFEEVIASAKQNETSPAAGSIVQPNGGLKEMAEKAFGGSTIGGKKLEELKKK